MFSLVPSKGPLEPYEQVRGPVSDDDVDHTAWVGLHLLPGDTPQGLRGEVSSIYLKHNHDSEG